MDVHTLLRCAICRNYHIIIVQAHMAKILVNDLGSWAHKEEESANI